MTERQLSKFERKREKQPISVPFIWEIKPGAPKKDWKPNPNKPSPANPVSPPVKLVVSVPFGWEEKPGTPLQSIIMPCRNSEADNTNTDHGRVDHEHELINGSSSDSELETCSFKTSVSFSSAMSNGLVHTTDLSKAVPAETGYNYMDTGSKRWVGASFLEWLFPLLVVPGLSLQDEVESREGKGDASEHKEEDNVQVQELKLEGGNNNNKYNNNRSVAARPLLTLGELIVMSRRRSIQKKIGKMKRKSSLDFMKRNGFGCCVFGAGVDGFVGLQRKWKRHLQLRLM